MAGRARGRGALLLALAAMLGACGPGGPGDGASASPGALPSTVTFEVEVAQARTDRVARVVELQVRNTGPVDVLVERARLVSDLVGGSAETGRDLGADRMRRLRVPLGPASCGPGVPADPAVRVELDVRTTEGRAGTVVVTPTDETDDLVRIHGEDCAAAAVGAGLRVTFVDELAVRDVDGVPVADVVLRVEPVPSGPHVRLVAVRATTLLRPWGPAGATGQWDVDVDSASPPPDGRVLLATVPARCDLHAIAEDKRGTVLGLAAVVDGVEQPWHYLAAPDALRGALYDFVLTACAGRATRGPDAQRAGDGLTGTW